MNVSLCRNPPVTLCSLMCPLSHRHDDPARFPVGAGRPHICTGHSSLSLFFLYSSLPLSLLLSPTFYLSPTRARVGLNFHQAINYHHTHQPLLHLLQKTGLAIQPSHTAQSSRLIFVYEELRGGDFRFSPLQQRLLRRIASRPDPA